MAPQQRVALFAATIYVAFLFQEQWGYRRLLGRLSLPAFASPDAGLSVRPDKGKAGRRKKKKKDDKTFGALVPPKIDRGPIMGSPMEIATPKEKEELRPRTWQELREQQQSARKNSPWQTYEMPTIMASKFRSKLWHTHNLDKLVKEIAKVKAQDFPADCIGMAMNKLGRLGGHLEGLRINHALNRLVAALEITERSKIPAPDIAKFVQGMGLLRYQSVHLLDVLLNEAVARVSELDCKSMSWAIHGLGLLGVRHEGFLNTAAEMLAEVTEKCRVHELVTIIHSMAKLDFRHVTFLRAASMEMPFRFNDFNEIELTNVAYAMYLLKFRHKFFLTKFGQHLPLRLPEFSPMHLSKTIHCMGKLKYKKPRFVRAVAKHIAGRVQELNEHKKIGMLVRSLQDLQRPEEEEEDSFTFLGGDPDREINWRKNAPPAANRR